VAPNVPNNFAIFLWALKLGALVNLTLFANTLLEGSAEGSGASDPHIVLPALILFAVSGYRCLFPNRYKDNVVLHDSPLSSTLVTRLLATVAEVAWIYQFSHVIRLLNLEQVGWVEALSWLMVVAVVISQLFVWGAILTGRLALYFYEELGWAGIFIANTIASAYLAMTVDALGGRETLLHLNLLFGAVYLPWQLIHLRALRVDARTSDEEALARTPLSGEVLVGNLRRALHQALHQRKRATDAASWGGLVGLTWMVAYWATLIPIWVYAVVQLASAP
jgi:hypothetical protein